MAKQTNSIVGANLVFARSSGRIQDSPLRAWFLRLTGALLCLGLALSGCEGRLADGFKIQDVHEHLSLKADADKLVAAMDAAGIQRMVLLGSYESMLLKKTDKDYPSALQDNQKILDAAKKRPDRFIPFVLLDLKMEDLAGLLEKYVSQGAKGVKLYNGHGTYRTGPADAPEMQPIYDYCEKNRLPVLIHMNVPKYPGELDHVLSAHPHMNVIAAHLLCMPDRPEEVGRMLDQYPNLYADMSFGMEHYLVASVRKISEKSDAWRKVITGHKDRILFGTDVCVTDQDYKTKDYLINEFLVFRKLLEFKHFRADIPMNAIETTRIAIDGLHLDRDTLKAIYEDNFKRIVEQ